MDFQSPRRQAFEEVDIQAGGGNRHLLKKVRPSPIGQPAEPQALNIIDSPERLHRGEFGMETGALPVPSLPARVTAPNCHGNEALANRTARRVYFADYPQVRPLSNESAPLLPKEMRTKRKRSPAQSRPVIHSGSDEMITTSEPFPL